MNPNHISPIGARMQALIYDCSDSEQLANFYANLLGGKVEADPYGTYTISVPGLGIDLGLQRDECYKKPVWLGFERDQQPMMHIDIKVANRIEAMKYALSIGAYMPEEQFCQPDWDVQWITLLDPAGHPFCILEE